MLLQIPNPQSNLLIFPQVCTNSNPQIFVAISDGFGSSVRESIFTYQVAVFKRRCITQWLLAALIILSAAVVIGKGGGGQWCGGQRVAPHCRPVVGKRYNQHAWCTLRNNPNSVVTVLKIS